jgi:hypothetical protein
LGHSFSPINLRAFSVLSLGWSEQPEFGGADVIVISLQFQRHKTWPKGIAHSLWSCIYLNPLAHARELAFNPCVLFSVRSATRVAGLTIDPLVGLF